MTEKLEEGMTICGGNSIERSDCFLHDEPCKHRSCKVEMGQKDPWLLAKYWLDKYLVLLDVVKEANKSHDAYVQMIEDYSELVESYKKIVDEMSDVLDGEAPRRRSANAFKDLDSGEWKKGVGL